MLREMGGSLNTSKSQKSSKNDFYSELAQFKGKTLVAVDLTYNDIPSNINQAEAFDMKFEVAGGLKDVEIKLDDNCSLVITQPSQEGQAYLPYQQKCKSGPSDGYKNTFRVYNTYSKVLFVSSEKEVSFNSQASKARDNIKSELLAEFLKRIGIVVDKNDLIRAAHFDRLRIENNALFLGTQYRSRTTTAMPITIEFKLVEKK